MMHPNSKASKVLAVLADGPAKTGEVAAELGWAPHLTCAHLKNLCRKGKITRERFPTGNKNVRYVWSLVG
jgi:predicted ArsR family transcriptional regulator